MTAHLEPPQPSRQRRFFFWFTTPVFHQSTTSCPWLLVRHVIVAAGQCVVVAVCQTTMTSCLITSLKAWTGKSSSTLEIPPLCRATGRVALQPMCCSRYAVSGMVQTRLVHLEARKRCKPDSCTPRLCKRHTDCRRKDRESSTKE